jgi:RNase H-fold protein (predicted Holliday junction resolvase)
MGTAAAAPLPAIGRLVGLDPGRSKCGLVCTDRERTTIVEARILAPEPCWETLSAWIAAGDLAGVILGNGTGSGPWHQRLQGAVPWVCVPEAGTTLAARSRYWELEPPTGWRRLLPRGLRLPPRDVDDVVAQLLLERWLGQNLARTVNT